MVVALARGIEGEVLELRREQQRGEHDPTDHDEGSPRDDLAPESERALEAVLHGLHRSRYSSVGMSATSIPYTIMSEPSDR